MKKFALSTLLGLFALAVLVSNAAARPDYKKASDMKFEESPIAEKVKEAKCNLCHFGKTKKNRNDYGIALSKHINKETYTEMKSDKPALIKKVGEALDKLDEEKNPEGETYGDRIKAGKLPGSIEVEPAE